MSTPFSDDSLLPKPAPAIPVSPHGEEHLLRSERAQWERRAAVAADAAADLAKASSDLGNVGRANYLGDCVEGISVYDGLTAAVKSLKEVLFAQVELARDLGSQCEIAASTFESADREGARDIEN
ncbi:hypothetical protein R4144_21695 [Gordonia amicalis]|uniref:hypothetical protein n=1 Tax=Gordonia amicalis TaxID=89053 RepID=UPI002954C0CA|nr:hypothetical protein [Gordonia amicalis]MDV7175919.1 hypothetical protein [Gordonia amicalis]